MKASASRSTFLIIALAFAVTGCAEPDQEFASVPAEPASQDSSASVIESQYTSLEECTLLESTTEGAGYSVRRCDGLGANVLLSESDGRQSVAIAMGDTEPTQLRLPEIAGNGGFSELGTVVEWRPASAPTSLIVRYNVVENPSTPRLSVSYLIVVRLEPTPCVIGVVLPDIRQNQRARELADGGGACLKRTAPARSDIASATLALEAEGLRVFTPAGSARTLPFGTPYAETMRVVKLLEGNPSQEGRNDCAMSYARWRIGLTVMFSKDRFIGWITHSPSPSLTTAAGVGVGSTRRQLEDAHIAGVSKSTLGIEFNTGGMAGLLESTDAGARITRMWAGDACLAR